MRLVDAPPPYGSSGENEGREFERRNVVPEVPALRGGEDAAVADWAHGPENAVQRLWGPVQVGSARTRIPTRGEPDIRVDEALEFPPEGDGAPTAEGGAVSE